MGSSPDDERPSGLDVHRVRIGAQELTVVSFKAAPAPPSLTPAERSIVERVLLGETNAEIARARRTSPRTVANQIAGIFRKLQVASRSELGARLRRGP